MGSWDSAPWILAGGVKHSTSVARLLSFAAFGGQEGIIDPLDLEVRARAVPDGSIRVAPGACSILNRNPEVTHDAYAARLPIEDIVEVEPTTSGAARTDLVVAIVKNPFISSEPYAPPSQQDIADGNYEFVFSEVIPNIPNVTPGQHPTKAQALAAIGTRSAIPLASVAMPASTGTVAQAYIKDQRFIAQFRSKMLPLVGEPVSSVTLSNNTYKEIVSFSIDVPDWATHYSAKAVIGGARYSSPQSIGTVRIRLGSDLAGQVTNYDESVGSGSDRAILMASVKELSIPRGAGTLRGRSANVLVEGRKSNGQNMVIDNRTSVALDVVFASNPETR